MWMEGAVERGAVRSWKEMDEWDFCSGMRESEKESRVMERPLGRFGRKLGVSTRPPEARPIPLFRHSRPSGPNPQPSTPILPFPVNPHHKPSPLPSMDF